MRLWRRIEALPSAQELFGEIMRAAQMGMTLVGTSVCDERAFSAMSFPKSLLRPVGESEHGFGVMHALEVARRG